MQKEKEINEASKNYQELILSKEQFIQNIGRLSLIDDPLNEEEKKLRNEILKLYELEEKLLKITNPIFKEVTSGSEVIQYFAEVLQNRMTERSIFDITKEKYIKQLEPIPKIDGEIKNQMNNVNQIMQKLSDNILFPRRKEDKVGNYINNLENICFSYEQDKEKLKKVESYYIDLENKIEAVIKSVRSWISKRKEERKMCLGTVQGRFKEFDPNEIKNPFENINNQNGNYYNTKDYYNPYPNHPNINNNYFPQNNNNNSNVNDDQLDQPYCSTKTNSNI